MIHFPRKSYPRRRPNADDAVANTRFSLGTIQLPNEILLHIFKYVSPHDLLFSLSKVSKQWRAVSQDPILWRRCGLTDEDLNNENLELLALAPTLQAVSLHTSLPPCLVTRALLHGNKDPRSLKIHFRDKSLTSIQLKGILNRFSNLEHVELRLPSASHDEELFSAFHALVRLQSMHLSGFVSPVSALINAILTHCPALHTLDLVDSVVSFRDEHLIALLSDGRPWRSLKLTTWYISEQTYECLAGLQDLQQLALIKCKKLTQNQLNHIAMLPKLQSLTLSENCILSSTALAVFFQSQPMARLQDINLTIYRADDLVALAIATTCTQLMHLRLAMCLLSDDGVRSIILNASHLVDLDLENNVIRGQWLHLIPAHLPRLKRLSLRLCYNVLVNLQDIVIRQTSLQIIDPTGNILADTSTS